MLATFLGLDIIRRVSRLLHTPLMSLTNAISSIAVVGAIIIAGEAHDTLSTVLGAIAVFASTTNLVSGYLITDRMLRMFKRREVRSRDAGDGDRAALPRLGGAVHPGAALDEPAGDGPARGRARPSSAWSLAVGGTLLHPDDRHLQVDRHGGARAASCSAFRSRGCRSRRCPNGPGLSQAFGGLAAGARRHGQVLPLAAARAS